MKCNVIIKEISYGVFISINLLTVESYALTGDIEINPEVFIAFIFWSVQLKIEQQKLVDSETKIQEEMENNVISSLLCNIITVVLTSILT